MTCEEPASSENTYIHFAFCYCSTTALLSEKWNKTGGFIARARVYPTKDLPGQFLTPFAAYRLSRHTGPSNKRWSSQSGRKVRDGQVEERGAGLMPHQARAQVDRRRHGGLSEGPWRWVGHLLSFDWWRSPRRSRKTRGQTIKVRRTYLLYKILPGPGPLWGRFYIGNVLIWGIRWFGLVVCILNHQ